MLMKSLSHITIFSDFISAVIPPLWRNSFAGNSLLSRTPQNPNKTAIF